MTTDILLRRLDRIQEELAAVRAELTQDVLSDEDRRSIREARADRRAGRTTRIG